MAPRSCITPTGASPGRRRVNFPGASTSRLVLACSFVAAWLIPKSQATDPVDVPVATVSSSFHQAILYTFPEAKRENMVCAPLSMLRVLRMLEAGADGTTLAEMTALLAGDRVNLDVPRPARHHQEGVVILRSADRLYAHPDFLSDPTFEGYCDRVHNMFYGQVRDLDFGDTPDRAAALINRYVAEVTADQISHIVSQEDLSADTRLAVISAMYIRAPWAQPFMPVGLGAFNRSVSGRTIVGKFCSFMRNEFPELALEYLDGPAKAVRLPYAQRDLAMYVFMPHNLRAFEEHPDFADLVDEMVDRMHLELQERRQRPELHQGRVHVLLPRFFVSAGDNNFDVSRVLEAMGVKELFRQPDLSRMTDNRGVGVDLFRQAAQIRVDEEYTTASAAADVTVSHRRFSGVDVTRWIEFNNSFLFQIRYQPRHRRRQAMGARTDLVLFSGHVIDCETPYNG